MDRRCLTPGELETVKIVFGDVKTKNGEIIWTGYPAGTELEVGSLRNVPKGPGGVWDVIRILGHQDKNYDWHNFDLDTEVAQADKAGIDVLTYDLSAFKAHGGKLLLYHGLADSDDSARSHGPLLRRRAGEDGQEAGRLASSLPGAGDGALRGRPRSESVQQNGSHRTLARGRPGSGAIIASHVTGGTVDMTRPLCPYPQVAVYKGVGSTNDAANFSCKAP